MENFWSSEQTSVVRLVDPHDAIEKMIYALTNPVKDGLVEKAHHWPGVTSLAAIVHGKSFTASRPKHFFRDEGVMPDTVILAFRRPRGFEQMAAADFATLVTDRIRQFEERTAAERRREGAGVLGRRAILRQSWRARPRDRELRRALNPRVAARSKWRRIEALLRNRAFRDAYLAARALFVEGVRDVLFPAGTYWLRRFARAACAALPLPS